MYDTYETSTCSNLMKEQHRSRMMTLDCFLRAHSMLNNFVEFLESRGFKYRPIHYKKIPLRGALEISSKMATPNAYKNMPICPIIERPGLFADSFRNSCCSKSTDVSANVINKIEIVIKQLTKSSTAKDHSMQIESMLLTLAGSQCVSESKQHEILSALLREIVQNLMYCDQTIKEPLAHIQTKTLLKPVSDFIRGWGERLCEMQPHLKICRFCGNVINDEARRYGGKFCCDKAEHFDRLLKEWISLYISQDTSKLKSDIPTDTGHKIVYPNEGISRTKDFTTTHDSENAEVKLIAASENDVSALENYHRNRIGPRTGTNPGTATVARDERRYNISDVSGVTDSRDVGRPARSGIETGHRDEIADGDLSVASGGDRSPRRGKTETSVFGARSDLDTRNADRPAGGIREKRDNNPYRRKLGAVVDKDRRDRRAVQRDVEKEEEEEEEEAAGSRRATAAKRSRGGDTEDATAEGNEGARDRDGRSYYQHRGAIERGTRSPDNSAGKNGRLDRAVERRAVEISGGRPAKRPVVERIGNGRRDRHENEEQPFTRRDRRKAGGRNGGGGTTPLSKSKDTRFGSEETTDSLDDAEKGRSAVNDEDPANDGRYDPDATKRWKVNPATGNPCIVDPSSLIEYQLSNAHFVELGWTLLPVTKTVREIVQYEARPAKPNLDWFERYRNKGAGYYDDGLTPFLRFRPDGSGELFYPNGVSAVRVHRPENRKYDTYTVFTPGGKDASGIERESQILAVFDTVGNGVVFDVDGATRLSYNQIGGIFTDNPAGPPLVWTWNVNPRESILETVYTERLTDRLRMEFFSESARSSGNVKTPISLSGSRNKEKKVVEVQKPVVEERQEAVGNKSNIKQTFPEGSVSHIKVICMRLNEYFSLRIVDRRNIALRFSARNKSIRIELGTVLNFQKKVAPCVVEASDWKSDMLKCRFQERLSAKLESDSSMRDLAEEYRKVKRFAKERKATIAKYEPSFRIGHHRVSNRTSKVLEQR